MKEIKLILLLLLVAGLLEGCVGHYLFKEHQPDYELRHFAGNIALDKDHYDLYVRKGYAYHNQIVTTKLAASLLLGADSLKDHSVREKKLYANRLQQMTQRLVAQSKIVEIEFLFLPKKAGTVLYISTVADRYQTRYNNKDFLGTGLPNVADFRVFLFGCSDENHEKIVFYDKDSKHADTWTMRHDPGDDFTLHLIEQKRFDALEDAFLLDDALGIPMVFSRGDRNWQIVYRKDAAGVPEQLSVPGIQVAQKGKRKNRYHLQFSFERHKVTFPNNYIIYDPGRYITVPAP